jgi:DNA repair exonuclease SbcCD ATPase subunit
MKRIRQFHQVQFFLHEKTTFDFAGMTGIFGPNGTGKTALLDALQIAMLGANEREAAFNARAEGVSRGGRSIKQYLLGQRGNDDPENRGRNNALCYLTLVYQDDETGEVISAGVCLAASANQPGYKTMGYYIVPGAEIKLDDHIELGSDGVERPLPWKDFRNFVMGHKDATSPLNADEYLRDLTFRTRPSRGRRPPQIAELRRSFRNAMRLKEIDSVDEAVRRYVIDNEPVDLDRLRGCAESFNNLRTTIAQLEAELYEARRVHATFERAGNLYVDAVTWDATAASFDRDAKVELREGKLQEMQEASDALTDACTNLERVTPKIALSKRELEQLSETQLNHRAHREQGGLLAKAERAKKDRDAHFTSLRASFTALARRLRNACRLDIAGTPLEAIAQAADAAEGVRDDLESASIEKISSAAKASRLALAQVLAKLQERLGDLRARRNQKEGELDAVNSNLQRIGQGLRELRPETIQLQQQLSDRGIDTRPLCDLAEVSDRSWQPAIEAFLGGKNLEALLVREHQERQAAAIFDGLPDGPVVWKSKLAPESLGRKRGSFPPAKGTAAALVTGDLPARNFLRMLLGELLCVESVEEGHGRFAITRSATLFSSGIERLQKPPPGSLRLGRIDQTERRRALDEDRERLEQEIRTINAEIESREALSNEIVHFTHMGVDEQVARDWENWKAKAGELEQFEASAKREVDADYRAICDKIAEVQATLATLEGECNGYRTNEAVAKNNVERLTTELQALEAQVARAQNAYDAAKRVPDCDLDRLEGFRDTILASTEEAAARAGTCRTHAIQSRENHSSTVNRANRQLQDFCGNHHRERLPQEVVDSWREALKWLSDRIKVIEESELVNYKRDVELAYDQAVKAFRGDVAAAIADQLGRLSRQMNEINTTLERTPAFSNNERYRFKRDLKPEHRALYEFVMAVGGASADDLLGSAEKVPESFRAILESTADPKLEETSPLYDYRRFFTFELEISSNGRVIDKLSSRLKSGSGGEHKTPLYVIAGASLASAWGKRDGARDGLGVMLLDEAFDKMDPRNTIATANYLAGLGLQLVFAAPGESVGTLTALMDNYYLLQRFGDVLLVEPVIVEEPARVLMKSDSIVEHPNLIEEEAARLRAAAAA